MKRFIAVLLLLISGQINAEIVTYVESTSGDLIHGETFPGLTNIGILGVGINTVNGNAKWSIKTDGDIADPFVIEIPKGLSLKSVTLEFYAKGLNEMTIALTKIDDISALTQFYTEHESIMHISSDTLSIPVFNNAMPASNGLYAVYIPASFSSNGFFDLTYTWHFEVAPDSSL